MDINALTQMGAAGLLVMLVIYILKYLVSQQDAKNAYMSEQLQAKDRTITEQRVYIDELHREAKADALSTLGVLDSVMKIVTETSTNQTGLSNAMHKHFESVGRSLTKLMESLDIRFTTMQNKSNDGEPL